MPNFDRTTLLGSYSTPLFSYGSVVQCEWRGEVVVTGLTNARILWPVGKRRGERGKMAESKRGKVSAGAALVHKRTLSTGHKSRKFHPRMKHELGFSR